MRASATVTAVKLYWMLRLESAQMNAEWSRAIHRRCANASGEAWPELDPSSEVLLSRALPPRRMRGERCSWNRGKRERDSGSPMLTAFDALAHVAVMHCRVACARRGRCAGEVQVWGLKQ